MSSEVFSISFDVRSYDLDPYMHVNNAVYLNYLEHARTEFMRSIGLDYLGMLDEGIMLYVTRVEIDYTFSARLHDTLSVSVKPLKLGRVSGVFEQIVKNQDGKICVSARVKWACVNKDSKPIPLPAKYMVDGLKPAE